MNAVLDIILEGVLLGGLYAIFASGLSLIFGVMRLVNLAHGDLIVLAAYIVLLAAQAVGGSLMIAFVITVPVMFGFGYVLQTGLLNRVAGPDILPPLLTTFGLSIILQNGMLAAFSADSRRISVGGLDNASITLPGGLTAGLLPLLTLIAAIAVITGVNQLFYRTALGRALRAVSDDPVTAQLMGIDNRMLFGIAFGMAMVICAVAGLFLGLRANFDPSAGPGRLIFAFEAIIIGGLGSLWGTLGGGIILGLAQTSGASFSPEWQILSGHIAFLVILAIRPRGLFPRTTD